MDFLAFLQSMVAVSCAAGILGVASPTVLVGAILVVYGGNQISIIPLVPTLLNTSDVVPFTIGLAAAVCVALLGVAIALFERKQF